LQIKTKIAACHTANSKPVKQEVNGTVILPPLVFPGRHYRYAILQAVSLRNIANVNEPLTTNIFAAANQLNNIHNKGSGMCP